MTGKNNSQKAEPQTAKTFSFGGFKDHAAHHTMTHLKSINNFFCFTMHF